MEITTVNNSIVMMRQIFDAKNATRPKIGFSPQKPSCQLSPISSPFPRAEPESVGVPSELLRRYYMALEADTALDMHSVTVIKDGRVIAEADFGAYDRLCWHVAYSASKSVTGLAIGMLIDEGKLDLDDRVIKIFEQRTPKLALLTLKNLTVRHLLTMHSGVLFNEAGMASDTDWVKGFLESGLFGEAGGKFNYNSMNTYMLSAIVREVSGVGLMEYLRPRLWEPLDIKEVFWETCPMGTERGGWGLFIRQEDFAKIGQLLMNGGVWRGKRLISQKWVDAATSKQADTPESCGDFDYGYQIWTGRRCHSFLFNGMYGQNILCFPDSGIIVASNAGIDEMFQQSAFYGLSCDYFARPFRGALPEDKPEQKALTEYLDSLSDRPKLKKPLSVQLLEPALSVIKREGALPKECSQLSGMTYITTAEGSAALGLLPMLLQSTQNNYTKGLIGIGFRLEDEGFKLTVSEGGAVYDLPVGFSAAERCQLSFGGEPQLVATRGRFARDEDERLVLILRVSFLEQANSRHIRLYFEPGLRALESRWRESPGMEFLLRFVDAMTLDLRAHPSIGSLLEKLDKDFLMYKAKSVFEPTVKARLRD